VKSNADHDLERELINDLGEMTHAPYEFVLYAFPWGEGDLSGRAPEPWQKDLLIKIGKGLVNYTEAIQEAVSAGHDVGKSALVAWIILWSISTHEDTRGVVTANTATQLMTKTWPELSKWYQMFIAKHWFKMEATSIHAADPRHEKIWRIDAIPWSIINSEAFAGLHNYGKRLVILFDEASAIHDKIWEVTDGATLDSSTEIIRLAFGNPTRNSGRFFDCFHSLRHRWGHCHVDSRDVSLSDKKKILQWESDYGIESDFFKVRVRGLFPNVSDRQFIGTDLVEQARGRHIRVDQYDFAPVIIGVDPAWTGGDETVIWRRQGLASSKVAVFPRNDDDNSIAGFVARAEDEFKADAVFIDQGFGTGIYSAGKQMGRKWCLIPFSSESQDPAYLNKRAEMWALMKQWLKDGGAIPDDQQLVDDLTGPEYIPNRVDGKIQLEAKDDMKKRGLSSPNRADALALTFAYPVKRKDDITTVKEFYNKVPYKLYS
jgi:hypothetical protein